MLLELRDLRIAFKHDGELVEAVHGVDLRVDENQIIGLVGESGSGKTVSALSIIRLLPKNNCIVSGENVFKGKDIFKSSDQDIRRLRGSEIAMIFQEPFTSLNPVLKSGEQIDEVMLFHEDIDEKSSKKRSLRLLEKVRMNDPERIYDSYPHMLSGGERQRVMIAMAIALSPKLLIADEPTTALDVTVQSEILEIIRSLKKDLKMSVLFITHDFGIINNIAEKVFVMKEGRIVETGNKDEILRFPKGTYTRKLLEAVPRITTGGENKIPQKSADNIITVKNLEKIFFTQKGILKKRKAGVQALKHIDLEIKKGRTLGIVGESGSGKTTLGKVLVGLLKADSGEIRVKGLRGLMQMVFQDPYSSLDPRMRMRDIILEGLILKKAGPAEKKKTLRDVLSKVHLDYKDIFKFPHQFSGGQRQRIAIARALAAKPEILILDEPVSSLDVITQSDILNLLKDLQKELALTYVFISHDLRVVQYMADEVAVMREGSIVELASRDMIYMAPKHPYTRLLLSSIPKL